MTLSVLLIWCSCGARRSLLGVGGLLALSRLTPARLQRRYLDIAARGDGARRILPLERIEGCPHHVVRVGRAERFGYPVLHPQRLDHSAHWTAANNAGARGGGPQKY